jgi:hypothetical protein
MVERLLTISQPIPAKIKLSVYCLKLLSSSRAF